ncbi:hypothetical protein GQ53DRAFT_626475, partial [Thozetella sp. PMI_491]
MEERLITPEHIARWSTTRFTDILGILSDMDISAQCPLDNGRHDTTPTCTLGKLDIPLELLANVLVHLDVPSLTAFRRVNRRAMQVVDSIPPYAMIYQHCRSILRYILAMGAAHYPLVTLFQTLCQQACSRCDHFGGYLCLLTCTRFCRRCFRSVSRPSYANSPLIEPEVVYYAKLPLDDIQRLPHVRAIPGHYGPEARRFSGRLQLWDRRCISNRRPFGLPDTGSRPRAARFAKFMTTVAAPYFEMPAKQVQWGLYCIAC